jgi:hypothetical protein
MGKSGKFRGDQNAFIRLKQSRQGRRLSRAGAGSGIVHMQCPKEQNQRKSGVYQSIRPANGLL